MLGMWQSFQRGVSEGERMPPTCPDQEWQIKDLFLQERKRSAKESEDLIENTGVSGSIFFGIWNMVRSTK